MIYFSILMSVHNGESYLKESIESVLNQSFSDFELLLFNDSSTDNSKLIINSFSDDRIKVFNSESNVGLTKALNFLILKSQGKYITRLDADDQMHFNRLRILHERINNRDNLFLFSNFYSIDSEGNILSKSDLVNIDLSYYLKIGLNPICHGSICFMNYKSIVYNGKFRYSQDLLFYFENIEKFKIEFVTDYLYFFRINKESISLKKSLGQLKTKVYIFIYYFNSVHKLKFFISILKKAYYSFIIAFFSRSHIYNRHINGKVK
jgi:glycosyltransferase involved in cell wall biosynthesis